MKDPRYGERVRVDSQEKKRKRYRSDITHRYYSCGDKSDEQYTSVSVLDMRQTLEHRSKLLVEQYTND